VLWLPSTPTISTVWITLAFEKKDIFIDSGTIESAAKRLGDLQLKEAGARLTRDGAVYTAKARAAWLGQH
jgi:hypothetical protein